MSDFYRHVMFAECERVLFLCVLFLFLQNSHFIQTNYKHFQKDRQRVFYSGEGTDKNKVSIKKATCFYSKSSFLLISYLKFVEDWIERIYPVAGELNTFKSGHKNIAVMLSLFMFASIIRWISILRR